MTSDVEPFSKYSPVKVHLSPASRIPSEAPASVSNKSDKQVAGKECLWANTFVF